MEWNMQTEIKRIRLNAEDQIAKSKEECEKRLYNVRSYLTAEIDVNSKIVEKLLAENKWKSEKLRKFGTMLRVPRLHFDYIDKHGYNEFVDYCEDIVRRERALQDMKDVEQGRIELREKHTISRMRKMKLSAQERHTNQMKDQQFLSPFKLQHLPKDLRREDHQQHFRKNETEMNLVEKGEKSMLDDIEMINFLQKRSVLNLSELIDKHRDK